MRLNIILIANQQRLQQLVSNAALSSGHSLTIATNLADGSSAISAATPSLLFLQSRLSGLSADIITRHFRSQKSASKSRIILLAESASEINVGETQADVILDASLSDDDLLAEIRKLLAESGKPSSGGKKRRSAVAAPASDTSHEPVTAPDEAAAPSAKKQRTRTNASQPSGASKNPRMGSAQVNSELDAMLESFQQELEGALKRPVPEAFQEPPAQTQTQRNDNAAVEKQSASPEGESTSCPAPPALSIIDSPPPTGEEASRLSSEDVTDTFSVGPTRQPTEPSPIKFQEELDTLLGTGAQAEVPPPAHESTLTGLTVEEVFLRTPPQPRSNWGTWAAAVIAAVAMGIGVFFFIDSPSGSKHKISPLPSAPSPDAASAITAQKQLPTPAIAEKNTGAPSGKPSSSSAAKPAAISPSQANASLSAKHTESAGTKSRLPRFIPAEALVKTDGPTNGWEKYVTPTAEFKIFREQSTIKALQVIDRSGKGLSKAFFSTVIGEMAGVRDYRLESKEKKGDYLIKKGRLSSNSRVILYKKNSDTLLQAFVIYFE